MQANYHILSYIKAKTALDKQMESIGYKPLAYPFSPHRVYYLCTTDWQVRSIIICFINLSEVYKVNIPQATAQQAPHRDLWILLGLYFINSTDPIYYLFPSTLFAQPGHIFARCQQSAWMIWVYRTRAIDALNNYLLCDINDL